jgi:deoxyribodipyrimidine photo-lyase
VSVSLHWFRSDLRTRDNTALLSAAAEGPVVALFIATPQQWQQHDDAPIKIDFWRRNLAVLEKELRQTGIPLLYASVPLYADIPALLDKLLPSLGVTSLHCNREFPLNELRRDQAVKTMCRGLGIAMHLHDDQVLLPPETVQNRSGEPFKVFTPWSLTVRDRLEEAGVFVAGVPARQVNPLKSLPADCLALDDIDWPAAGADWPALWPAGEQAAQHALAEFSRNRIEAYRETRDLPGTQGTSRISHFLAAGVLSIRDCWQQAAAFHAGTGIHTWQNELLWRDFYKHVMWHFPHVCKLMAWKQDFGHVPWRHDEAEFTSWCNGETGIPIIDAAMHQLLQTGWMHNRLRMIVAMFLSKHLLIDWRWGERWFMQHLIDGDFSANNGGWQWSASTGTDAAPYFRIFNPVTQSRRFDPDGDFIRRYLPALASLDDKSIHDPGLLAPRGYPAPMVDLAFGRERALNAFRKPG